MTSDVPHFQEHQRFNPMNSADRMSATAYSTALDYLVIACVDLVLTHRHQILVTQRNRPPRNSWWIVGGRMAAGEAPLDTACRKAAEEAQLHDLSSSRFRYVGVYSTCFASRHQPPQHHGLHSLNLTYQVELTMTEKAAIALDPTEYAGWQWVEPEQISGLLDSRDGMDAALLRIVQDLAI